MIYCPSCGHVAHTRRAHFMDDGTKIMIAQCRNIYCSATFEASESFFSDCKDSGMEYISGKQRYRDSLTSACRLTPAVAAHRIFILQHDEKEITMESTALQQAFDTCQNNKAAWLQRKNELAAAEQEYLRLQSGEGRNVSRLDELRNIIEVRKWQVNQAAGRYIRSHEAVQHISIRDRLNDFMQQHGTALAAALAPELMGYSELTAIARNCAIQRATDALREALLSWLAKGEKINYSAQDSDILTTIGFRPDAASVDDSREKFTPAQNMIFSRKSAQLASRQSV